jgi:hypothetical protein
LDENEISNREALHRSRRVAQRGSLRSLAKKLAEGAGHDYRLIRAAFEAVDSDDSGWVSPAAFQSVFVRFGLTQDVGSQVISLLEPNNKGCVNYVNLMALCGPVIQQGLRSQPRFQPPVPALRPQEQQFGPHGWRTWRRTPAVKGQAWAFA